MRKNFGVLFGIYFFLSIYGLNAYAQNFPDAGTILRETEKQEPEQKQQEPVIYKVKKVKEASTKQGKKNKKTENAPLTQNG